MKSIKERDAAAVWHPFTQLIGGLPEYAVVKATGNYLYLEDGRKILDAISSWWVNLHGHAHPKISKAVAKQSRKLEHIIFAGFTHEPAVKLAESLLKITDPAYDKVFYSDNGPTSTEVAIKMALQWWHNQGTPRKKILAFEGAYHGDTFGAMAVGERGDFTTPFHEHLFDVDFIPFPDDENAGASLGRLRTLLRENDYAAFIFEPLVQGSAGMRMCSPAHMNKVLDQITEKGIITIADEVFTGFGRLGTYFAFHQLNHVPDILCLSKGITGGYLPLGATVVKEKTVAPFRDRDIHKTFFHGHSYTANPLSCAAANASLQLLTRKNCQQAIKQISKSHKKAVKRFSGHAKVKSARSLGTMMAIEWQTDQETSYTNEIRHRLYPFFIEHGILLRPLGNVVYVLPPYTITMKELDYTYQVIEEALDTL